MDALRQTEIRQIGMNKKTSVKRFTGLNKTIHSAIAVKQIKPVIKK